MPLCLLRILPSRRIPNRVWLIFSGSFKLPFFIDDVVILSLKSGQEVDSELLEKIKEASLYYLLYNYSLNQIAISPKISRILIPKIKQKLYFYQKKYSLDGEYSFLADKIISKLSDSGLLSESLYADFLLKKNHHRSRYYLTRLFSYYNLDLPSDYQFQDQESIRNILIKKKSLSTILLESAEKNKLIASLARKGFAYNDIKTVIDELLKKG